MWILLLLVSIFSSESLYFKKMNIYFDPSLSENPLENQNRKDPISERTQNQNPLEN